MAQLRINGLAEVYGRLRLARLLGPRPQGRRTAVTLRGDASKLKAPRKDDAS